MDNTSPVPQSVWQRLADPELKRAFARHLSGKPDNQQGRFEAARLTMPDEPENSFLIFQIMEQWPNDITVIAERDRLAKTTPSDALPTLEQTAKEVYNLAIDNTKSVKERLEAYRLYGELMQMLGKNSVVTNNTTNNTYNDNRGVYVIPQRAAAHDPVFEGRAKEQQARLIADARATTV